MSDSRFRMLATGLYGLTLICQIALPLVIAGALFAQSRGVDFGLFPQDARPTGRNLWLGVAAGLLPTVALFWALELLRRLFGAYRRGDVLTEAAARLIRSIGVTMFILAGLNLVSHTLQRLFFTLDAPPGQTELSIVVSQADLGFLLLAGLLTLIGWAMTEAARNAQDIKAIV